MTDDITLRVAGRDDLEFLFHVLKTSLGPYLEQTYGSWDEEEQRARFFELTKPETHQIVERAGEPIGCLDVRWLPGEVNLRVLKVNPAQQLYERLGFVVTGQTDTHFLMERTARARAEPTR